jgi:precorrin-6A/cobalt-precorrin-6A reductase
LPGTPKTVLILGGTREASRLARLLDTKENLRVITSLAGRTRTPETVAGECRVGGFGGIDGLVSYLREQRIDLLVDATHPFAGTISSNAEHAARQSGTRLMVFRLPPWKQVDGDVWRSVASLDEARAAIPPSSRVLLALGHQHIAGFAEHRDVHFVIRMVDPPDEPLPFQASEIILGKPGDLSAEEQLLRSRSIDHLVCRNSGGSASYAKIEAARKLSIPVIMIERPPVSSETVFTSIDELAACIY